MRIYIASFFDTRTRLHPMRAQLNGMGHTVVSQWLDEADAAGDPEVTWPGIALRDRRDVTAADLLLIDTLDETPRGGREVELGLAMAQGKPVIRVGPKRNVYHHLLRGVKDWEAFFHLYGPRLVMEAPRVASA